MINFHEIRLNTNKTRRKMETIEIEVGINDKLPTISTGTFLIPDMRQRDQTFKDTANDIKNPYNREEASARFNLASFCCVSENALWPSYTDTT